jgi:succinoglycan biosynthesis protein ExoA
VTDQFLRHAATLTAGSRSPLVSRRLRALEGSESLMGTRSPTVSIVIPMLNESGFIEPCLEGFAAQTFGTDGLEVIVVDGGSVDGSRSVVEQFARRHGWCSVVDNPRRKASAAFNVGVRHATGEYIALFSAHGEPDPEYVARSVQALIDTGAAGVGGTYVHEGGDPVSRAVGLAMVSPFGMASPHRWMDRRGEVDTISHPVYRAEVLRSVDPFDETLERNSDYELNWRLREAGHRLVLDPQISSLYRPRASLAALCRQFWWYGRWKERVVRRHPASLRPRHVVPPSAVVAGITLPVVAVRVRAARWASAVALAGYLAVLCAATLRAEPRAKGASLWAFLACFPVMHGAWGAGFLVSFLQDAVAGPRDERAVDA